MRTSVRKVTLLMLAVFVLNAALSFHNIWPTPWITMRSELSVEAALLVLGMALYGFSGRRATPRALSAIAGILLIMVIGRYMEVTAPALYGRAVNIYWDAQHLPAVVAMLAQAAAPHSVAATVIASLFGIWLIFRLLRWSVTTVRDTLWDLGAHGRAAVVSGAVAAAYFASYHIGLPALRWYSIPVSQTYARQAGFVVNALRGVDPRNLSLVSTLDPLELARLPKTDLIVSFVESYGATAYDAPEVTNAVATRRAALLSAAAATGRRVVSAFVLPPTFGGASWLSHASFLTGIEVADNASHDLLLTQQRRTLPRRLRDVGFRTIALMPGLRGEWPEGGFYGFDQIYGAKLIDYQGPDFGWWRIPDQFSLARIDALELAGQERAPVFVFFPTISTHMPFRPTPPYQADWQRLLSTVPFLEPELGDRMTASPQWLELRPAYADAIAYTYDYWSGYLRRTAGRSFTLLIVGDHQPPSSVSGDGVRWDVPVHVVSDNDRLIANLLEAGFVEGLSEMDEPTAAMHELASLLLTSMMPDR